jgi:hypothetical protein
MITFKITSIVGSVKDKEMVFNYTVSKDSVELVSDSLKISSDILWRCPSDGRSQYIKDYITSKVYKNIVVDDVKSEFSDILNVDIEIAPVKYETQAEIDAKTLAAEIAEGTVNP